MKVDINEWHAVASWTWSAEDDACGICRLAPGRPIEPSSTLLPLSSALQHTAAPDIPPEDVIICTLGVGVLDKTLRRRE